MNMSDQLAGWTKRWNLFGHRVIGGQRMKSQDVDHAGEPSVHDRRCGPMAKSGRDHASPTNAIPDVGDLLVIIDPVVQTCCRAGMLVRRRS